MRRLRMLKANKMMCQSLLTLIFVIHAICQMQQQQKPLAQLRVQNRSGDSGESRIAQAILDSAELEFA